MKNAITFKKAALNTDDLVNQFYYREENAQLLTVEVDDIKGVEDESAEISYVWTDPKNKIAVEGSHDEIMARIKSLQNDHGEPGGLERQLYDSRKGV